MSLFCLGAVIKLAITVARAGFAMVYPGAKAHQVAVIRYGFYKIVTNDTLPDDNWSSVYD
jgi:hypothetical protein